MSSIPKHLRRDEAADLKAAYIEQYEAYKQAGRDGDADHVAGVLRDEHDHDVTKTDTDDDKASKKESAKAAAKPETTSAAKPAEDTAAPRARKTQPKK